MNLSDVSKCTQSLMAHFPQAELTPEELDSFQYGVEPLEYGPVMQAIKKHRAENDTKKPKFAAIVNAAKATTEAAKGSHLNRADGFISAMRADWVKQDARVRDWSDLRLVLTWYRGQWKQFGMVMSDAPEPQKAIAQQRANAIRRECVELLVSDLNQTRELAEQNAAWIDARSDEWQAMLVELQ